MFKQCKKFPNMKQAGDHKVPIFSYEKEREKNANVQERKHSHSCSELPVNLTFTYICLLVQYFSNFSICKTHLEAITGSHHCNMCFSDSEGGPENLHISCIPGDAEAAGLRL